MPERDGVTAARACVVASPTQRVVVAGAGVAGSLIVAGLAARPDIDLICLERAGPEDQADAGTGLNIGPNAMTCLGLHLPASAAAIRAASLPWRRWSVGLTDGTPLLDLDLAEVADDPGIRIRWAELTALLRRPIRGRITFGAEVTGYVDQGTRRRVTWIERATGRETRIDDVALLIAADGRYSSIRRQVMGDADTPRFLGACLFRLLIPCGPDCPIDDYGQWFQGPNRLLAYRVPGDAVYCAGSFPIPADTGIPEAPRQPEALAALYRPVTGAPCAEAGFLIDALRRLGAAHWARLQDAEVTYGRQAGVLLVGDGAHPMVPTLGQGATQACEDACVVVDEVLAALAANRPLGTVAAAVARRRTDRARFVTAFSRAATDTMLAGADPVAGTRRKAGAAFRQKLHRLYRDIPKPHYPGPRQEAR